MTQGGNSPPQSLHGFFLWERRKARRKACLERSFRRACTIFEVVPTPLLRLVAGAGIEPATSGLWGPRSTTELPSEKFQRPRFPPARPRNCVCSFGGQFFPLHRQWVDIQSDFSRIARRKPCRNWRVHRCSRYGLFSHYYFRCLQRIISLPQQRRKLRDAIKFTQYHVVGLQRRQRRTSLV